MECFDQADMILPDIWAAHAQRQPSKPALICDGSMVTWRQFNSAMNRLAHALLRAGLRKGDTVAVLVSSSIAACEAMFGVVKSGGVVVPISGMLAASQVSVMLADCAASFIIASADLRHLVQPVPGSPATLRVDGRIGVDFEGDGWTSLDTFCDGFADGEPDVTIAGSDVFSIMYSSGTTGRPKGVVHTHGARTYFSVSNGFEMLFDGQSRGLVTTALYTTGTWMIVLPTLFAGGTLHIQPRFRPDTLLAAIAECRITHTFVVPSQIQVIFAGCGFERLDLSSLKVLLSAGSPLRADLKTRLISIIGQTFFELYGFTEGGSTLLRPLDQGTKPLSVGNAVLGQELLAIDADDQPCPPDVAGEIVARGPGLLRGYHGRPKETLAARWVDARGRSFVRTGDVGKFDADGFLYILDRKKDMIISGGLNVYTIDLEMAVGVHPAVSEVTVIGIEHEKWGEVPIAVVVLCEGADVSPEDLLAFANASLAKHQRIAKVDLCASLPRNALGKVLKRELRDAYAGADATR